MSVSVCERERECVCVCVCSTCDMCVCTFMEVICVSMSKLVDIGLPPCDNRHYMCFCVSVF